MTDLDPAIWENETLGAAARNKRLDVIERQEIENHAAELEDREPRKIVSDETHPGYTPPVAERTGTVPSNFSPVHFEDEQPHEVPQTGEGMKPEGMSDEEWSANSEGEEVSSEGVVVEDESPSGGFIESSESPATDSTEEDGTTKWT